MPTGGSPSMTPTTPRPRGVTATSTPTGLALAQKIVHTSGTALSGLRTFTGKPSRSSTTNECPAATAAAFTAASVTSSGSFPDRRTSRSCDASQKPTPKRR